MRLNYDKEKASWSTQSLECHELKQDCTLCSMRVHGWKKDEPCKMYKAVEWLVKNEVQSTSFECKRLEIKPISHLFRYVTDKGNNSIGVHRGLSDEQAVELISLKKSTFCVMRVEENNKGQRVVKFDRKPFSYTVIWGKDLMTVAERVAAKTYRNGKMKKERVNAD